MNGGEAVAGAGEEGEVLLQEHAELPQYLGLRAQKARRWDRAPKLKEWTVASIPMLRKATSGWGGVACCRGRAEWDGGTEAGRPARKLLPRVSGSR